MRRNGASNFLTWAIILIVGAGLLGPGVSFFLVNPAQQEAAISQSTAQGRVPCLEPGAPQPEELRIRSVLKIVMNGAEIPIPANIGLDLQCKRVIHTGDDRGIISIEPNFPQAFTLGNFFWVWDTTFSRDEILGFPRDAEHEIVMTVDGQPSEEYENLILRDKQEIVIEYRKLGSGE